MISQPRSASRRGPQRGSTTVRSHPGSVVTVTVSHSSVYSQGVTSSVSVWDPPPPNAPREHERGLRPRARSVLSCLVWSTKGQPRASTVCRAVSTPHCSSGVRCPARFPRRVTSTAPTCSTSTRVSTPSISISGRNEAGFALVEVGATSTTERGRSGSACTTTPYRRPCCSCPTPLGSRNAKMSPRRTQAFHDAGNLEHLGPVVFVGF